MLKCWHLININIIYRYLKSVYTLYNNTGYHFKVMCCSEKGIKLNPLSITLMDVLENMYCTASLFFLDLFSLFSLFISFFPFFLLYFVSFLLISYLLLSPSAELCFSFSRSPNFCSSPPKTVRVVFLCPSYISWLTQFFCFLILFLLHHLPVFLNNLPTFFSSLFSFMC